MNRRNVDALERILVLFPIKDVRVVAQFLARKGCLGPVSEVLTDEDIGRLETNYDVIVPQRDDASIINAYGLRRWLTALARGDKGEEGL